jgi:hypothetical protein
LQSRLDLAKSLGIRACCTNPDSHPRFAPVATVAINVRHVERDQLWLMPPSVRYWLPEDHLAWFVHASMVAGADHTAGVKGSLHRPPATLDPGPAT